MTETLNDKVIPCNSCGRVDCSGGRFRFKDVKEAIKNVEDKIGSCIERGQFNETYFKKLLRLELGEGLVQ